MPWAMILSVPGHHGEAADPELLAWIKQLLDQVLGSADWVIVAMVGLALVAFPIGLILFYLAQAMQKLASARFSMPQLGQSMVEPPSPGKQVLVKVHDTSGLTVRQAFPARSWHGHLRVGEDRSRLCLVSNYLAQGGALSATL